MQLDQDTLYIFTDGSCYPNPGPGGWGCVMIFNQCVTLLYGYEEQATNNSMELRAILEAVDAVEDPYTPVICSDSQYGINAVTKWWRGWEERGWVTSAGNPVSNYELIRAIVDSPVTARADFRWVRGHAGNMYNDAADKLASAARAVASGCGNKSSVEAVVERLHSSLSPHLPIGEAAPPGFMAVVRDMRSPDSSPMPAEVKAVVSPPSAPPTLRNIVAGIAFVLSDLQLDEAYAKADAFLEAVEDKSR